MREKIKQWLRSNGKREFVIVKFENMGWTVYLENHKPKAIKVQGPGMCLAKFRLLKGCAYTQDVKCARLFRKWYVRVLRHWLTLFSKASCEYRIVSIAHAAFVPGLTGPSINSPVGVISLEN